VKDTRTQNNERASKRSKNCHVALYASTSTTNRDSNRCHEHIEQDEEDMIIHDGRESGTYDHNRMIYAKDQTSTHRDVWVRSDMTICNATKELMSHTIQFYYENRSNGPHLFSKQIRSIRGDGARSGRVEEREREHNRTNLAIDTNPTSQP
jgi:hypothetical protein